MNQQKQAVVLYRQPVQEAIHHFVKKKVIVNLGGEVGGM